MAIHRHTSGLSLQSRSTIVVSPHIIVGRSAPCIQSLNQAHPLTHTRSPSLRPHTHPPTKAQAQAQAQQRPPSVARHCHRQHVAHTKKAVFVLLGGRVHGARLITRPAHGHTAAQLTLSKGYNPKYIYAIHRFHISNATIPRILFPFYAFCMHFILHALFVVLLIEAPGSSHNWVRTPAAPQQVVGLAPLVSNASRSSDTRLEQKDVPVGGAHASLARTLCARIPCTIFLHQPHHRYPSSRIPC